MGNSYNIDCREIKVTMASSTTIGYNMASREILIMASTISSAIPSYTGQ